MATDLPDRTAGVDYPEGTTQRRLTQIGADVSVDGDRVTATPPSWRPDLKQPADLVEEVLRLEGLENIPSVLPQAPAGRGLTPVQKRRRAVGKSLALNGYVEILPTPFLPAGVFDQWGLAPDDPRRTTTHVLNPLEADRPELATTLLPGLLESLARNVSRGAVDAALFSIEQVVEPTSETRAVELIPTDRRPSDERDRDARRLAAQPAGARRRCAGRPARAGGSVGTRPPGPRQRRVRGGAHHRPRRGRRVDAAPGAVPAVASRSMRRSARRRHRCRPRRPTASRGHRAVGAAEGHLRRRARTSTRSRSPRRCPRPRCRRSPRCSRTSP